MPLRGGGVHTIALRSEAAIKLILAKGAANDPQRIYANSGSDPALTGC